MGRWLTASVCFVGEFPKRYYDRTHKDYHVWNDVEDRAAAFSRNTLAIEYQISYAFSRGMSDSVHLVDEARTSSVQRRHPALQR